MPEWIGRYWLQWLFGLMGTGLLGAFGIVRYRAGRLLRLEKRMEGLEVATRATMYDRLYYLHGRYVKQGWVSVADLKNIEGIYNGYHGLGGNGTGTKLFDDLKRLPNYPGADKVA